MDQRQSEKEGRRVKSRENAYQQNFYWIILFRCRYLLFSLFRHTHISTTCVARLNVPNVVCTEFSVFGAHTEPRKIFDKRFVNIWLRSYSLQMASFNRHRDKNEKQNLLSTKMKLEKKHDTKREKIKNSLCLS